MLEVTKRVLDPCCGSRMMWFDRGRTDVIFGDNRRETVVVTDRSHCNASGTRTLTIDPDVLLDFRSLPYPDDDHQINIRHAFYGNIFYLFMFSVLPPTLPPI